MWTGNRDIPPRDRNPHRKVSLYSDRPADRILGSQPREREFDPHSEYQFIVILKLKKCVKVRATHTIYQVGMQCG